MSAVMNQTTSGLELGENIVKLLDAKERMMMLSYLFAASGATASLDVDPSGKVDRVCFDNGSTVPFYIPVPAVHLANALPTLSAVPASTQKKGGRPPRFWVRLVTGLVPGKTGMAELDGSWLDYKWGVPTQFPVRGIGLANWQDANGNWVSSVLRGSQGDEWLPGMTHGPDRVIDAEVVLSGVTRDVAIAEVKRLLASP